MVLLKKPSLIVNLLTDAPNAPIIRINNSRLDKCAAGPEKGVAVLRLASDFGAGNAGGLDADQESEIAGASQRIGAGL